MKCLWWVAMWCCLGVAILGAEPISLRLASNEKLVEQAVAQAQNRDGFQDGEVARIESYGVKNPILIRVTPSYYYLTTSVFGRENFSAVLTKKEDLRGYRLGIIRGVQHSLDATEGLPLVEVTQTAEQLYKLLASGRIDLAIDTGINGTYYLKKLNLTGFKEVGTLGRLELFHYLNPRHQALAPKISAVIQKLIDKRELPLLIERQQKAFLASGVIP